MKCIYSKSYFSKFLQKNNINNLFSKTIKKYPNEKNTKFVLKPDAPILGKANVYMIDIKIFILINLVFVKKVITTRLIFQNIIMEMTYFLSCF